MVTNKIREETASRSVRAVVQLATWRIGPPHWLTRVLKVGPQKNTTGRCPAST